MDSATFTLKILTPERAFFEGEASEVIFSTPEGRIGAMSGHAPMIASVSEGIIEILVGGEWKTSATGQGFCEITYDLAEFFVDTAEWAEEIDAIRAREALERAELRIRSNMNRMEFLRTQAAMSRAIARLKAIETSGSASQRR